MFGDICFYKHLVITILESYIISILDSSMGFVFIAIERNDILEA